MTNFYRFLFPFLDALLRDNRHLNVIFGIFLGIFLGMFPIGTLQWITSLFLLLLLRANLLAFLSLFLISFLAANLLDPVWNSLGFRFLTNRSNLYPLWGWMSHAPIIPFTDFNNTVVLGVSIVATVFACFSIVFYTFFRKCIRNTISKFWYQTKISRFYAHYRKY